MVEEEHSEVPETKRLRTGSRSEDVSEPSGRVKGIAPIKPEYIIESTSHGTATEYDDDAEGQGLNEREDGGGGRKGKKRGQNKNRKLIQPKDTIKYCEHIKEGNGATCPFGESCRFEHDLSKYIASKPADLEGVCPVFAAIGYCPSGLKCRWLGSHYKDGSMVTDADKMEAAKGNFEVNRVLPKTQYELQRKRIPLDKSEAYIKFLDSRVQRTEDKKEDAETDSAEQAQEKADNAAAYVEAPLLPSEKKKIYLDRAKILSPLTTVGNLPYRRLMKTLGADVTYSEMALSFPLVQGAKSEWALVRAHSSEVGGFGVQIAAPKHWQAIKAAEAVAKFAPTASEINLNCGCPIDLLYRQGAGSALLDNPARLLRMVDGMNAVSGDIPVTIKIRTGTRDGHPTAINLVNRVLEQGYAAAITLHGRSRAQRYTKLADWSYIKEVADVVKEKREDMDGRHVKPWIIGNGDVYSWKDWYSGVEEAGVDSIMVARGALIKPWIFEEIDSKQYLDKSATERLDIIKKYAYYGIEHWGSDEYGINQTRRFLCEFLSFTHRYIPVGLLEYLPPKLNDRPPPWKGRNELETLLGSTDYRDWIKISEMFLGPVSGGFEFTPKHKSNSYDN